MANVREYTNKLLGAVDDGEISAKHALRMCLDYMSEDDVKDMCKSNELFEEDEEELFRDIDGAFGVPGDIVSKSDCKEYWDEYRDVDPCLQEYDSFESWWGDTKEFFDPI